MGLFDFLYPYTTPEQDDAMSEVDSAIAHNEARGDPVPDNWYALSDQGVPTFDDEED